MKILYAIQGTGNGHISRATEIIPYLMKKGSLDILVSGNQNDIPLPYPVKYQLNGMTLVYNKKGGVSYMNTYLKNHIRSFIKEVRKLPVENYDLVINDFEPISAWSAYMKKKPCFALSNQCAVLSENAPKPDKDDKLGRFVINNYAPATAHYGFHFAKYDEGIFTPVIRKQIREMKVTDHGHYTVYLPAYSDEKIMTHLKRFDHVRWEVFSKNCLYPQLHDNVLLQPIDSNRFIDSLASCTAILCGAGFSTPSEALFLKKKLMVIPMKWQYEQQCNAVALQELGVPVIKSLKKKHYDVIEDWIKNGKPIEVDYQDITGEIVDLIFENFEKSMNYRMPEVVGRRKEMVLQP